MEIPFFVFVLVWIGQIVILSFISPIGRSLFMLAMVKKYPLEEYPGLYPLPFDKMLSVSKFSASFNAVAGLISAGVLVMTLFQDASIEILLLRMNQTFIFQIFVRAITLVSGQKLAKKAIQAQALPSLRFADMNTRRLNQFVSPFTVGLYLSMFITAACLWIIALFRADELREYIFRSVNLIFVMAFFVIVVFGLRKKLRFIREVKIESYRDANRHLGTRLKVLIYVGIMLNVFSLIIALVILGFIPYTSLAFIILTLSLMFQFFVLFVHLYNWREIGKIDADSYREQLMHKTVG